MKDVNIYENLSALAKTAKADKRMLETLKVETVEALERLKRESELFAKKITDAGQHDNISCLNELIILMCLTVL